MALAPNVVVWASNGFFDPDLIVPNGAMSLRDGALAPWKSRWAFFHQQTLSNVAKHFKFSMDTPWNQLPAKIQKIILHGSGSETIKFDYDSEGMRHSAKRAYEGIIPSLSRRYLDTESDGFREEMEEKYQGVLPCQVCKGARLKKESLFIKIDDLNIAEVSAFDIQKAFGFFQNLELSKKDETIAKKS